MVPLFVWEANVPSQQWFLTHFGAKDLFEFLIKIAHSQYMQNSRYNFRGFFIFRVVRQAIKYVCHCLKSMHLEQGLNLESFSFLCPFGIIPIQVKNLTPFTLKSQKFI